MTEEKPYISPPPEAEGNYKYYIVGTNIPVRLKFNENGHRCLTEALNPREPDHLQVKNTYLGKILKDEDVREITKEEFVEHCRKLSLKRKANLPSGLNM